MKQGTEPRRDWTKTQDAAYQLAREIESFWRTAGYSGIRAWVEPRYARSPGGTQHLVGYDIRSNICGDGFPPIAQEVRTDHTPKKPHPTEAQRRKESGHHFDSLKSIIA